MEIDGFNFITDIALQKNIIDSIDFSSALWLLVENMPERNRQELYRTIILYTASAIEALLNYYISQKRIIFEEEKCVQAFSLPPLFQNKDNQVVLAIKKKEIRENPDFAKMTDRLKDFLGKTLTKDINYVREIRNTYHLLKLRKSITEKDIQKANKTLLSLVKKIQKDL